MSKYLDFIQIRDTGKTKVWQVQNKSGAAIGKIGWYGPWRKYVFYPHSDTLWDNACLRDMVKFIEGRMAERRTGK